jgi:hypothetical protein
MVQVGAVLTGGCEVQVLKVIIIIIIIIIIYCNWVFTRWQ